MASHSRSTTNRRSLSLVDNLIDGFDQTLRNVYGMRSYQAARATPRPALEASTEDGHVQVHTEMADTLSVMQKRLSSRLMRVNHSGEVAAQALYRGQALASQDPKVRAAMKQSADEEIDHLVWCEERIAQLQGQTSLLNPLWYAGSFAIGYCAGVAGDNWSLGFIGETERQVALHLDRHLEQLPENDAQSREILQVMKQDEERHGQAAMAAGGQELPNVVKSLMKLTSKVMTRSAYWL